MASNGSASFLIGTYASSPPNSWDYATSTSSSAESSDTSNKSQGTSPINPKLCFNKTHIGQLNLPGNPQLNVRKIVQKLQGKKDRDLCHTLQTCKVISFMLNTEGWKYSLQSDFVAGDLTGAYSNRVATQRLWAPYGITRHFFSLISNGVEAYNALNKSGPFRKRLEELRKDLTSDDLEHVNKLPISEQYIKKKTLGRIEFDFNAVYKRHCSLRSISKRSLEEENEFNYTQDLIVLRKL